MRNYSLEDFKRDLAALGLSGHFDAEDVQAMWKAKASKAGFANDQKTLLAVNVARDRLIDWLKAGRPTLESGGSARSAAPPPTRAAFQWPPWWPIFDLEFSPVLTGCQTFYGVPVPIWFAGWAAALLAIVGLTVIDYAALLTAVGHVLGFILALIGALLAAPFKLVGSLIADHIEVVIVGGIAGRVGYRVHRYIERDIRQVCPKCKKPGVLQMVSDEFINSRWHSHDSTVGHGKHERHETRYDTVENWRAKYVCDDCGHSFTFNYPKFYMNNPSIHDPMHLCMGILRILIGF